MQVNISIINTIINANKYLCAIIFLKKFIIIPYNALKVNYTSPLNIFIDILPYVIMSLVFLTTIIW